MFNIKFIYQNDYQLLSYILLYKLNTNHFRLKSVQLILMNLVGIWQFSNRHKMEYLLADVHYSIVDDIDSMVDLPMYRQSGKDCRSLTFGSCYLRPRTFGLWAQPIRSNIGTQRVQLEWMKWRRVPKFLVLFALCFVHCQLWEYLREHRRLQLIGPKIIEGWRTGR